MMPELKKSKNSTKNRDEDKSAFKTATFDRPKLIHNKKLVLLIRNGERVDRVFPEWLNINFTDAGEYIPTDLNQPIEMLQRTGGIGDYLDDSPITEIGGLCGQILGRAVRTHGIWPLQRIYSSPALRCVQTAAAFITGSKKPIKICIEPGLFDYMKWYKTMPCLLTTEEMVKAGFPIDTDYVPRIKLSELCNLTDKETIDHFYSRSRKLLNFITSNNNADRIAIFCHSTTLDASIKALRKVQPRAISDYDMNHMGIKYPYATIVTLAHDKNKWSFVHQPIVQLSYLGVSNKSDVKFINQTTRKKNIGKCDM